MSDKRKARKALKKNIKAKGSNYNLMKRSARVIRSEAKKFFN